MNVLIQKSATVNPESNGSVCGRGLAHRKLDLEERKALAADVVSGERPFQPSLAQTASLFGITVTQIREELKERAAARESKRESDAVYALVGAWEQAAELEREVAIRMIGVAQVWDVLSKVVA
jgi:hypothetical protein